MRFLNFVFPVLARQIRRHELNRLQKARRQAHANLDWFVMKPGEFPLGNRPTLSASQAQQRQDAAALREDLPWARLLETWMQDPNLSDMEMKRLADEYAVDSRRRPDDLITFVTLQVLIAMDDPRTPASLYPHLARMGHASSMSFFGLLLDRMSTQNRDLIQEAALIYQATEGAQLTLHARKLQAWSQWHLRQSLALWSALNDEQRRETLLHLLRQRGQPRGRFIMKPLKLPAALRPHLLVPLLEEADTWREHLLNHDADTPRKAAWAQVMAEAIFVHLEALPRSLGPNGDLEMAMAQLTAEDAPAMLAHLATRVRSLPDLTLALEHLDVWRVNWEAVIPRQAWLEEGWPASYRDRMPGLLDPARLHPV